MNHHDYNSLFASLNEAVQILARNRTSDPDFIRAYDTLKQTRALLVNVLNEVPSTVAETQPELIAA